MSQVRTRQGRLLALVLLAAALGLAACGGDSGSAKQAAADQRSAATESAVPADEPPTEPPPRATPGARFSDTLTLPDGTAVEYTTVLPADFTPGEERPVLLAFPPGGQQQDEVDFGLDVYWSAEAQRRGWIVVSPVAPAGGLFFAQSASLVPDLVDALGSLYPPEGGRMHVAGISNGGLSSFRAAIDNPDLFSSLLVLPGFPPDESDYEHLDRLAGSVPVTMYVGE
ncbi:MAG: hypothetical protein ACE5EV_07350, partial [Gaiellales bacterium]